MPTRTVQQSQHHERSESREKLPDLYAAIASLADQSSRPSDGVRRLLELIAAEFNAAAAFMSVVVGDQDIRESIDHSDTNGVWTDTLRPMALEAHASAARVARVYANDDGEAQCALLGIPIPGRGGEPIGGLALVCPCESRAEAQQQLSALGAACAQAGVVVTSSPRATSSNEEVDDLGRVYTKAVEYQSVRHFAFAITNGLRNRLGCEQAAMGTVVRGRINILCVSGLDDIKLRSPGVQHITQAMGECADRNAPIVSQALDRWSENEADFTYHLHERWRIATGDACVASVPIRHGDRLVGVISLKRPASRPFGRGEIETAEKLIAPLAGAIPLVSKATQSTATRISHDVGRLVRWAVTPRSPGRKLLLGMLLVAITWFAFAEGQYRLTVPAAVVAHRQHVVAAPLQGRIDHVCVRAGQHVAKGELLAAIDTTDLRSEMRQLDAEITRLHISLREAVSADETVAAAILQREAATLEERYELLTRRLAASELRAPVDGMIITENTEDLVGRIVPLGEPLLMIADTSSFLLELHSPDGDINDLEPGREIRFVSHARPESPGVTRLARVAGVAAERQGRRVFVAEADVPDDQDWLRPGMNGMASIDAGRRPIWWITTHRVTDAARLNFWLD